MLRNNIVIFGYHILYLEHCLSQNSVLELILTDHHIVFAANALIGADALLAVALRQTGHVVVLRAERAPFGIVEGDHYVRLDHLRPAVGAAQAERHVLVLAHSGGQLDEQILALHLPLDLHALE